MAQYEFHTNPLNHLPCHFLVIRSYIESLGKFMEIPLSLGVMIVCCCNPLSKNQPCSLGSSTLQHQRLLQSNNAPQQNGHHSSPCAMVCAHGDLFCAYWPWQLGMWLQEMQVGWPFSSGPHKRNENKRVHNPVMEKGTSFKKQSWISTFKWKGWTIFFFPGGSYCIK